MQPQPVFKLQQLQQRHPQAFYQRLYYGSFKLVGGYNNPLLHILSLSITFLSMFCMYSIFALMQVYMHPHDVLSHLNLSLLIFISLLFPLLCWAKYQAQHSSYYYARRLNISMHICALSALVLGFNSLILFSETLSICIFVLMCLNVIRGIWVETLYASESTALQRFELQQLRKMAYWTYQQSRKSSPLPIEGVTDLKMYYCDLHQQALHAEKQLSEQIQIQTWVRYLY